MDNRRHSPGTAIAAMFGAMVLATWLGGCTAAVQQLREQPHEQPRNGPPDYILQGALIQGGLVRGQTQPGVKVYLDGKPLRVGPMGDFVFGLGREAAPNAMLELTWEDEPATDSEPGSKIAARTAPAVPQDQESDRHSPPGLVAHHILPIEQRKYVEQHIRGVPQRTVSPPAAALPRIGEEVAALREARSHDSEYGSFREDYVWPATGPITGVFGSRRIYDGQPRRPHYGVDVAAPEGTPVTVPTPGLVRLARDDMFFTGGTVVIDHGYGVFSTMIHLSRVLVKQGQWLDHGAVVGEVGATGRATGPHLHWQINWFQLPVDPQLLVPPMADAQSSSAAGDE